VAISRTIPAISHVAVTVTDLSVSEPWYTRVFGVEPVLDEDTGPFRHIVYALGGTLFGLHGFPDLTGKEPFDERTPGLDHVSFVVSSGQTRSMTCSRCSRRPGARARTFTTAAA